MSCRGGISYKLFNLYSIALNITVQNSDIILKGLTHTRHGLEVLPEDPHVEGLTQEVLEARDGVDGMMLAVDVDGVGRHVEVLAV